jgi:hypothetical protein
MIEHSMAGQTKIITIIHNAAEISILRSMGIIHVLQDGFLQRKLFVAVTTNGL